MQQIVMKENLPHPNHKAGEGRRDGHQDHGTMYKKQSYKVRKLYIPTI